MLKKCSICNVEKEISFYGKHSGAPDGLDYRCRQCKQAQRKDTIARRIERNTNRDPYAEMFLRKCYGSCKRLLLPNTSFHKNRQNEDGLDAICKECSSKKHKISWKKDKYGLDEQAYEKKLSGQSFVCEMCDNPETVAVRGTIIEMSVDHDHRCCSGQRTCGKCTRGILCARCNHIIGHADDNIELLEKAILYLRRYSNGGNNCESGNDFRTD